METLHPRVRIRWSIGALTSATILAVIVAIGDIGIDQISLPAYAPYAVGIVLGTVGVVHAFARYGRWQYEIQEDALYLERGVFTQVETAVPFVRVQHVDTQRSPFDRLLGIASVVVYTAGSRGADVTVPGLTPARAESLRNRLRELAIESEPRDGV